jgi:hypothetical protein
MLMKMPIHLNSAPGMEIYAFLKERLNLPDNCIEVTVKIKRDDLITVTAVYYPTRSPNERAVTKTYDLFPQQ